MDWKLINLMWRALCGIQCSWDHVHASPCLGSCSDLWKPGEARQLRAAVLHQTFWRNDLVPGQRSQGRWASSAHAEARAVSLFVCSYCFVLSSTLYLSYFIRNYSSYLQKAGDLSPVMCFVCFQTAGCCEPGVAVPNGSPTQWVSPGSGKTAGLWHGPAEGEKTHDLDERNCWCVALGLLCVAICFWSGPGHKKWVPGVMEKIRSECSSREVKPRSSHLQFPAWEV